MPDDDAGQARAHENPMTTLRLLAIGCFAVLVVAVAYLGWRNTQLNAAMRNGEAKIEGLAAELMAGEQRCIALREAVRQETLNSAARSPDEFLALFPAQFPSGDWQPAETRFEDCWFRSDDGLRLHGWMLRHTKPKAAVLLVHGNAGNLTHRAARAAQLSQRNGASVLIFDYRGYGRSEGTPTIGGLLDDARAARALLAEREGIQERDVVLLGESLGGAVAVELAARDGVRGLILESTFSTLRESAAAHYPRLLVDALVADRLDSATNIRNYHGPLLQVHGDADRTIPLALGEALHAAANEPKQLLVLPGHDHNDPLPESYLQSLDSFLAGLP
jgi:fermentation-respiration switch protein FrsA (DUF1100 family)